MSNGMESTAAAAIATPSMNGHSTNGHASRDDYKSEVKLAARGRWHEIIPALTGIPADHLDGKQRPCVLNGGDTKQRTHDDFAETGGMHCNDCGAMPDGIEVIKRTLRVNFQVALSRVAKFLSIDPPSKRTKSNGLADQLQRLEWSDKIADHFLSRKPGISRQALIDAGAFVANWSNKLVIAFPIIGQSLDIDKPTGYVMVTGGSSDGLIHFGGKSSDKVTIGKSGLIGLAGVRRLQAGSVQVCIKCEGLTDLLAVMSAVPETSADYYAIVSNAAGCSEDPKWMAAAVAKAGRTIIAHDADTPGQRGIEKWVRSVEANGGDSHKIILPYEIVETHGKDTRDFLNEGNSFEDLIALAKPAVNDGRATVLVTPDEHIVTAEIIAQLHRDTELFQRNGELVEVVNGAEIPDIVQRPAESPTIDTVRPSQLRGKASSLCYFAIESDGKNGEVVQKQVKPPDRCIEQVFTHKKWPGVPRIFGIALSPFIRRDGTIVSTRGYDVASGIYLAGEVIALDVSDHPSQQDARAAAETLLDLVSDFPFESGEHKSAWLSALLTLLARHTFNGPTPFHLIDANVRGSGKTKLADIISIVTHGREIARMANPHSDEEANKVVTSVCIAGDPAILVDNVAGNFGGAVWDAVGTSTRWRGRILKENSMIDLPLTTVWLVSENNIVLIGDMPRRVLHVRLKSPLELPETRTDFKYPNIEQHTKDNRGRYLSAGLTILRAYFVAGKPQQKIEPMDYPGWSSIIRQALVFAGQPDPAATRHKFVTASDQESSALRSIVENWSAIDPSGAGLTATEIVDVIREPVSGYMGTGSSVSQAEFEAAQNNTENIATIREAIIDLCKTRHGELPTSRQLGCKLRAIRQRVVGDKWIDSVTIRSGAQRWIVETSERKEPSPVSPVQCQQGADYADYADDAFLSYARESKETSSIPIHDDVNSNAYRSEGNPSSASSASSANGNGWVDPDYAMN